VDEAVTLHQVVVGVDGSAGARTALDWGLREARLRGLTLRLVTVWPEGQLGGLHDSDIDRSSVDDADHEARARMRAEATEIAAIAEIDAVPLHADVTYGQPAQQLVDTAGSRGLLVVGSRGRGSLRGALLGSVSQQCAEYARGPVVVVRKDESAHGAVLWHGAASRVVVGVDGSAGSVVALRFAAAEARLRGGELHGVHAWTDNLSGYGGLPWAAPATTLREEAEATLLESMRAAWQDGSAGVQVRAEIIEGAEWDVLTEAAQAADLLVVGSRGRTGWASLLLGSVSLRCITYSPCPVAVVRSSRAGG
jgi:nucleotide-binding universal stress UspA family protein